MREIILAHIGQCGNQVGHQFWQTISDEHAIGQTGNYQGSQDQQLQHIDVYYDQTKDHRYLPRAIFTDLESGTMDSIRASTLGKLYKPYNFMFGQTGASNIWAKGYYNEGAQLMECVMDITRKEVERCQSLEAFSIIHSLGGGTGSGMGSLFLEKIHEMYPNRILQTYSVFPSSKVSDCVLQPYNTTLSFHKLMEYASQCFMLQNQALFDLSSKRMKIERPTYRDLNNLVSSAMSSLTCCSRFPGQLNTSLRKMSVNLVPFPQLHFFSISHAPLTSIQQTKQRICSLRQLTQQMYDPNNLMSIADPRHGRYLTASAIFRGKVSTKEVDQLILEPQNRGSSYYVEWIPGNIQSSICDRPPKDVNRSATFIANSTATQETLRRIVEQFQTLYKRSAFLHWYRQEGIDLSEFDEACNGMNSMISQYQMRQDATAEQDDSQWQQYDGGPYKL